MNSLAQQHALRHSASLPRHFRPVSRASTGVRRVDGNLLTKTGITAAIGTITCGNTARTNNADPHAVTSANQWDQYRLKTR